MTRLTTLTIAAVLLALPLAAAAAPGPIDRVPLMKPGELKEVPGTPVPIVVPARPKPCAPIHTGELTELPGLPIALSVRAVPCYAPVMTGGLTELPGTPVTVQVPTPAQPRK
jgi:hypothetical protein